MGQYGRRRKDSSKDKWIKEEVAAALGIASVTAGSKLKNAEQLCRRLSVTRELLLAGRITAVQARVITEASNVLSDDVLPVFEERVLRRAPEQTVRQLKGVVARAVLRLDPASAEDRKVRAVADRCVRIADAGDGMAWLSAQLPAEQAQACGQRIDAAARLPPTEDPRTVDQQRADLLVDGLLGGLSGELPARHGLHPHISVMVNLQTLTGVQDEPGWLDGYGPITADTARALAADDTGTWRAADHRPHFWAGHRLRDHQIPATDPPGRANHRGTRPVRSRPAMRQPDPATSTTSCHFPKAPPQPATSTPNRNGTTG